MKEEEKQAENILDGMKQLKIEKFMKVGFTKEQAELLVEEIRMSGMGFGFF